ncbi:MAG: lipid asymmetry maintenance protein MlaB [Bdellovibrio bacteriovorus]
MKGARLITAGPGRLRVEGALDFGTVGDLVTAAVPLFPASGRLRIDLSGVESANSAGLALLLEWLDLARSRRLELEYLNLPSSLERIAAFSNLGPLLPTTRASSA